MTRAKSGLFVRLGPSPRALPLGFEWSDDASPLLRVPGDAGVELDPHHRLWCVVGDLTWKLWEVSLDHAASPSLPGGHVDPIHTECRENMRDVVSHGSTPDNHEDARGYEGVRVGVEVRDSVQSYSGLACSCSAPSTTTPLSGPVITNCSGSISAAMSGRCLSARSFHRNQAGYPYDVQHVAPHLPSCRRRWTSWLSSVQCSPSFT